MKPLRSRTPFKRSRPDFPQINCGFDLKNPSNEGGSDLKDQGPNLLHSFFHPLDLLTPFPPSFQYN